VFYSQPGNNLQFYPALNFQKDSNPQQTSFAGRYKRSATGEKSLWSLSFLEPVFEFSQNRYLKVSEKI
jgi:hypothetical protein